MLNIFIIFFSCFWINNIIINIIMNV